MKIIKTVVISSLLLLASCGKLNLENMETGRPYAGNCQGQDCVIVIDQVEKNQVVGRVYLDEGELVAKHQDFSSELKKNGKGQLLINGEQKKLTKVKLEKGLLKGTVDGKSFELRLSADDEMQFKPLYMGRCFDYGKEEGRVYAPNVKGYWKSYKDTNESFVTIYLKKAPELLFARDLDLDMDVYYPMDDGDRLRPLLVLIHGGAFYNGDKQSIGYPEMGRHFAERGYVVASINYRLGFGPTADDVDRAGFRGLQDAHAAVCYLLRHSKEYRIDPKLIFAAGTSAGAITALNLAFMRDENRPDAVLEVGTIDAVSGDMECEFKVSAVSNMWGAVHDLSMLANSPETSIISFHGDEDHVVPYAYGYPFDGAVDLHVDNVLSFFGQPSVSQLVFNPMQGSKCIHDKAQTIKKNNGEVMRSELHTVCGESIHHLHVDRNGRLTSYFYDTILPATTRFFCEELVGGVTVGLEQAEDDERLFVAFGTNNVSDIHWYVEGGSIVCYEDENSVKVMLFDDALKRSVAVGGKYENGVEYCETWKCE